MTSPAPRHVASRRRINVPALAGISAGIVLAAVLPSQIAHAAPATVASDSFSRTVSAGWGSATTGGAWTGTVRSGATASVQSGQGVISGLAKSTSAMATLSSVSSLDTGVVGTIGLPSTPATLYTAFEIRKQSNGSSYRGRLELSPNGKAVLAVSRVTKAGEVNLGRFALPGTFAPGQRVVVEFQVTGTSTVTIRGRAKVVGAATPGWQLSVTDSSSSRVSTPGGIGLWEYAGGGNSAALTTTLDDLKVTRDPSSSSTPPATTPPASPAPSPSASTPSRPAPAAPPAGSTPAQPADPTQPDRGSVAVGGTSYKVPSDAVVVSPSGSDSAAGSLASPLRTVGAAIARASSGDTIVLRAGSYNESVTIPRNKTLTVQSYPGEAVWFDGSKQVTDWSRAGSDWAASWSYFPSSVMDGIADNPFFVDSAKPLASHPDQVFVDGRQLTQVGSASAVTPGTFYADSSNGRVVLGTDPSGHSVRISNQPQAIKVMSPNTVLQGFGVKDYATSYLDKGAVRLSSTGDVARNLVIQDNAMIGINVENDAADLDHLTVTGSGLLGIGANSSYGLQVRNSVVTGNNSQAFNAQPVAGGVKVTRSRGVTVSNIDASDNTGTGIWFDESVYDGSIVNSTSSGNSVDGILAELSDHIIVAGNELNDNKIGVIVYNTANVEIYNNAIGNNRQFGVKLAQDQRRQANTGITGHDRRRPLPDPTLTWIVKNVTIANNAFGSGGLYQIYGLDGVTNIPMDAMQVTITGNLFNQHLTSAQSTLVGWGGGDNHTVTRYNDVSTLGQAKGSARGNDETTGVLPISGMLSALKGALGIAVGLPGDVADALGVKPGSKGVGPFHG
ncbi:right-handed parallel beta-helix repeat-containing protein [Frondihabitans peucedani]|uniref:Right handed beta helix domain-containing protein n=1 Tax=Frondihabitans peucedani TaxID=598626 RepID=A0ABP8E0E8_9MICO